MLCFPGDVAAVQVAPRAFSPRGQGSSPWVVPRLCPDRIEECVPWQVRGQDDQAGVCFRLNSLGKLRVLQAEPDTRYRPSAGLGSNDVGEQR